MTDDFLLTRDGWLNTATNDAESCAVARLRVSILGDLITRNVSKRGGGESEAINTSLLPLAEFIAQNWWTLLYEPVRPNITDAFRIRHRLDSGMRGYAFPAIALWSGGKGSIVADWANIENPFATISFLSRRPDEPAQLERDSVEVALMDLVETVIERCKNSAVELRQVWDRVRCSIANPDEVAYCVAAGSLGLDPYDPDGPDLSDWANGIPETLFTDVAEIVEASDLSSASDWLREQRERLRVFPEIDLSDFGAPAVDHLKNPAWMAGQASAELLRDQVSLSVDRPRSAVDRLVGSIIAEGGQLDKYGPNGISAIVERRCSSARIGTVARSARQRRFRACAAVYMAWTAKEGDEHAATDASTRRQQASRAFAAEMLAPRQALIARAPRAGFDGEDLQDLAGKFVCPFETVMWQAVRAGIPLRGVVPPAAQRAFVVTPQPLAV
ncbi:hypothetical protein [Zavarzinia sp. CC-PAN008]|uniref:hypothetical protein n=1 Tax=Zavarzinia sp. CC-PAN008 TaxID=3243332 RepID=UPI003F743E7C